MGNYPAWLSRANFDGTRTKTTTTTTKQQQNSMSDSKNCTTKHIDCGNDFEFLVVGDRGVGKSCFLSRYAKSTFKWVFHVGVDCAVCSVNVDGETVNLKVWDTPGQDRFRSITAITKTYYRKAQGVFI